MPPIRRYVRISPHSLLEVRIFLENPADGPRWLLSRTDPALPKVFAAVQPLILPKLREERERTALTKGKGKKGKSVKDVVDGDGFRVVVFLTEGGTRHEVAVKIKTAKERGGFGAGGKTKEQAVVIREEDEDGDVDLSDIPAVDDDEDIMEVGSRRRGNDENEEDDFQGYQEDKKKLGFDTRYEGFSIWGKVLCLLVERKKKAGSSDENEAAQKVMQDWISSTQVGAEDDDV